MKFKHPVDTKALIIGIVASISAVIIWDIIKKRYKLLNYKIDKHGK